jgi:hypothetical protein
LTALCFTEDMLGEFGGEPTNDGGLLVNQHGDLPRVVRALHVTYDDKHQVQDDKKIDQSEQESIDPEIHGSQYN